MDNNKKVAYQILKFLESQKTEGTVSPEIDSAISSISNTFNVNLSSVEDYSKLNYFSSTLGELIDAGANALGSQTFETSLTEAESNPKYPAFISTVKKTVYFDGVEEGTLPYIERHSKVLQKFKAKLESSKVVKKNDAEAEKEAEVKKASGNDALQEKDYNAAVRLYTEAIELSPNGPNSHIYYSNRAAAHCYLTSYELAIADCEKSVSLSPTYVKAYTRLGLAHYSMKNFDGAIEAYKKCIELEPKVKSHKDSLTQAKQKALEYKGLSSSGDSFDMGSLADSLGAGGAGGKGGMPPGLAGMMQNPSLMKAAQDMMSGGGKGLDAMLKNPAMMQMAQKMMQNPAMMQQAMSMLGGAGGAGGGGGGMPDLSSLAGMMGGLGDMGGDSAAGPADGAFFAEDNADSSNDKSKGKGKKGNGSSSSSSSSSRTL